MKATLELDYDEGVILMNAPGYINPVIKQIPGARYHNKTKQWKFPYSYPVVIQIDSLQDDLTEVIFSDSLKSEIKETFDLVSQQYKFKELDVEYNPNEVARWNDLSSLQKRGTNWLAHANGAILGDELGSGKTVMSCVALNIVQPEHVLIVCPNSVKSVWEKHIYEWTNLKPVIIQGPRMTRIHQIMNIDSETAMIMNWEQLRLHSKLAGYGNIRLTDREKELKELNYFNFEVIIADEAHRMKAPKAKQTRALWALKGDQRWALTGTPIANSPADFWSLLHFIEPWGWPSRSKYIDRYCATSYSPFGGYEVIGLQASTRKEFDDLTGYVFMRRQKHEIMGKIIGKSHVEREVELTPKHMEAYKALKEDLIMRLENEVITLPNALAATTRLVQMSAAMIEIDEEDNVVMKKPSPKVDELMNLLDDLGEEPIVVFSASKQLVYLAIKELKSKGISYVTITGDTPGYEREDAVNKFQSGKARVFIGTTGASGEGITLTRAKYACMLQRPWSMVESLQAEDRIHRWGQEADSVTIIDILTKGTIDSRIRHAFKTKKGRLQDLTKDELIDLL